MKFFVSLASLALICTLGACTKMVERDYPKYLEKNAGESQLPTTRQVNQYYLPPETKSFSHTFSSFFTGVGMRWVVEVGKMLEDTMQSQDVQGAFGGLKAVDSDAVPGSTLVLEVQEYKFEDFGAHLSLNAKLLKGGRIAFEKSYTQTGRNQAGKMVIGGTFAQKNAVHQSTKLAMDEILRQLIADLNGAGQPVR